MTSTATAPTTLNIVDGPSNQELAASLISGVSIPVEFLVHHENGEYGNMFVYITGMEQESGGNTHWLIKGFIQKIGRLQKLEESYYNSDSKQGHLIHN